MIFILSAATVSFRRSMYNIDESVVSVKFELVLSNPLSTNLTVQVTDEQATAKGKWITNEYVSVSIVAL